MKLALRAIAAEPYLIGDVTELDEDFDPVLKLMHEEDWEEYISNMIKRSAFDV